MVLLTNSVDDAADINTLLFSFISFQWDHVENRSASSPDIVNWKNVEFLVENDAEGFCYFFFGNRPSQFEYFY